ncbi:MULTISPECIES: ribosome hibernation-promoting factor, HPF/YfiA family [Kocuria]|jgi:ribosomal subunit interface protein|uniref:ribosome hibernation-promoting factor, HPF/YfiA family n=1 Tax=Kocuria TaxID=57493 RepID=UPI0020421FEA|nr:MULTISPECIES: ribosome-associated translation inhibitor RaiA [Kocuria]MCM3686850.1 ribosome-associated translation inhibitor RaiA [Kocuria rosea]HST73205.1 ribosome-associated translation inhibitor RaiA [Kocuria rosea]
MELNVMGRNAAVPERFKQYVAEKVVKFEELGDKVQRIDVKVTKDCGMLGHQGLGVEITVVGRGPVLRAESRNDDKFAAFDEAYGKLLERLRRARDRRKVHRGAHRPTAVHEATGALPVVPSSGPLYSTPEELATAEEEAFDQSVSLSDSVTPVEIRRKRFPAAELSVDEAVDHMELVGHDFYLFVDKETGEPSAVYRRKGWSYGVISLSSDGEESEESARAYQTEPAG